MSVTWLPAPPCGPARARERRQRWLPCTHPKVVCYNHAISADGKFVAYEASPASGPPPVSGAHSPVQPRHRLNGPGSHQCRHPTGRLPGLRNLDMTPDGQRIVFVASTNGTSGATTCILLWDAATGAATLVSGDLSGQVPTNSTCDWPAIDPSGRFVVFSSTATNLTTNTLSGEYHLLPARPAGGRHHAAGCRRQRRRLTRRPVHDASAQRRWPLRRLRVRRWESRSQRPQPRLGCFRARPDHGQPWSSSRLRDPSLASLSPNGPSQLSTWCVSADGRYVVFASEADNLVPNDTNGSGMSFVRDQVNGTNILVSAGTNGFSGDGLPLNRRSVPMAVMSPSPATPTISWRATPTGRRMSSSATC